MNCECGDPVSVALSYGVAVLVAAMLLLIVFFRFDRNAPQP